MPAPAPVITTDFPVKRCAIAVPLSVADERRSILGDKRLAMPPGARADVTDNDRYCGHIVGQIGHCDSLEGTGARSNPPRFERQRTKPGGGQAGGEVAEVVSSPLQGGNQGHGGTMPVDLDLERGPRVR